MQPANSPAPAAGEAGPSAEALDGQEWFFPDVDRAQARTLCWDGAILPSTIAVALS